MLSKSDLLIIKYTYKIQVRLIFYIHRKLLLKSQSFKSSDASLMNEAIQEHGIQRNSYAELQSKSFVALMLRAFFAKTCLSSSSDDCDQYDKLMTSLKPVDANIFKDFKTRLKESIQALNNKFIDARKDERLIEIVKLVDKLTAHSTKEEIDIISGLITELNEEIDENADEANKKGRGKISTAEKAAADQAAAEKATAEKATAEKALADKLAADQAAADKAAAEKALADQAAAEKAAAEKLAADQAAAEKTAAEKAAAALEKAATDKAAAEKAAAEKAAVEKAAADQAAAEKVAAALEKAAAEKAKLEAELTELKKQLLVSTLVDKKRQELELAINKANVDVNALNAQMDELTKEKAKAKMSGLVAKVAVDKANKDVVDAKKEAETAKEEAETAKRDAETAKRDAETAKRDAETVRMDAETAVKNAKSASLEDKEKAKSFAEDANKKVVEANKEAADAKDKQIQMERELAAALADVKAAKDLVNTAAAAAKLELDAIKQESQLLSANTAIEKETAIRELEETRKQLETVNAEKAAALAAKVAADAAKAAAEAAKTAAELAKAAAENGSLKAVAEKEQAEKVAAVAEKKASDLRSRLAFVRSSNAKRRMSDPKTINQELLEYIKNEASKYIYPITDTVEELGKIRGALQNFIENKTNNYTSEQLQKILANKQIATLISVLQKDYGANRESNIKQRTIGVNLHIIKLIIQLIIIDALHQTNPTVNPETNAKFVKTYFNDIIDQLNSKKNISDIVTSFKTESSGIHELFKVLITAESSTDVKRPQTKEALLKIFTALMPMKPIKKMPADNMSAKKPLNKKGGSNLKKTRKKKNKRLED